VVHGQTNGGAKTTSKPDEYSQQSLFLLCLRLRVKVDSITKTVRIKDIAETQEKGSALVKSTHNRNSRVVVETQLRTLLPMSGRFRGGRGGRGAFKGRGGRKPHVVNNEPKKKKTIEDFYFYVGSSKQASDFETTSEFLINHVKKTFERGNDIAEALRMLKPQDTELWKPTLNFSASVDATIVKQEDRQNEMIFKADLDEFMKRRRMYENNLFKAYALIWERCAKAMQNKIASRTSFETTIYNDPIELLIAVKEHALNYQETRYEMSIISDAFRAVFYVRQKESESLQDYTRRFKAQERF
jgi:hypothetical protein